MKIGVLTSSRADFGIYLPLLKVLKDDPYFQLELIVFGTHLSIFHGYTVQQIIDEGFEPTHQMHQMLLTDEVNAVSTAYALTALKFADFWKNHLFDCVFCLGDRYEMAAAVAAGIPYNVAFAHFHGGETTLGAIDNTYRHSITLASKWHFVAAEPFKERVKEIKGTDENCFVTGSLSLLNMKEMQTLSIEEFRSKWQIDLSRPSILITLHPETVNYDQNEKYASEIIDAFTSLSEIFQLIITMPNTDTSGTIFRKAFIRLKQYNSKMIFLIENFGTQSYFTCMKYAGLVVGNSSSGIIEAASFGKYAINIGDRQKGRLSGGNVITIIFSKNEIIKNVNGFFGRSYHNTNPYFKENVLEVVINTLKHF